MAQNRFKPVVDFPKESTKLQQKISASVILMLFISGNGRCNTTDPQQKLAYLKKRSRYAPAILHRTCTYANQYVFIRVMR